MCGCASLPPRSTGPRRCRCPCPGCAVTPRSPCRRGCCAWAAGPGVPLRAGSACSCGRWWAAARPRRGTAAPRSGRCTAQVTHPGPAASAGCPCSGHSPAAATAGRVGRQAGTALWAAGLSGLRCRPCVMLVSARGPEKGNRAGERSGVQVHEELGLFSLGKGRPRETLWLSATS